MVESSSYWLFQQSYPWELSAFKNCMIAPVDPRQHEFLPASIDPFRVSSNSDFNGFGFSGLPERGHTIEGNALIGKSGPHSPSPLITPCRHLEEQTSMFPSKINKKPSTGEKPCHQEKRFLIFDQSGNETRLIFNPPWPRVLNVTTAQTMCPACIPPARTAKSFGVYQVHAEGRAKKGEQACTDPPFLYEDSGENEIIDEGDEVHEEDTEEINALLYSDSDSDGYDGDEDDEVSTGHSPLAIDKGGVNQEEEEDVDDEVTSHDGSSKRQKVGGGGHAKLRMTDTETTRRPTGSHEDAHIGDLVCALDQGVNLNVGSKRLRKDNIRDTLRALESIIPGLNSKDPLVILEEAISYLKRLRHNADTFSAEDTDSSGCFGPLI